jgi:hypothetical protein
LSPRCIADWTVRNNLFKCTACLSKEFDKKAALRHEKQQTHKDKVASQENPMVIKKIDKLVEELRTGPSQSIFIPSLSDNIPSSPTNTVKLGDYLESYLAIRNLSENEAIDEPNLEQGRFDTFDNFIVFGVL